MKHINFILNKPRFQIGWGKIEFNYLVMVLITAAVVATGLITHLVLSGEASSYQQRFALLNQTNPKAEVGVPTLAIVGMPWSEWLKKYSAEFPRYLQLNKISGMDKDTKKIVLEEIGQTVLDASRAKKHLIRMGLCKEAELKNINQTEEGVTFALECSIL